MAFSTDKNREDYSGNDAATSFPLRFPFQQDADVVAIITNTLVTPNVEYPLVLDVDYRLTGAGESSGTLTFPLAGSAYPVLPTGWTITARRVPGMTQETDFQPGDGVPAEPLEDCLDRAIMVCLALQEQINRCLALPVSYSGAALSVPLPVANAVLAWSGTANALVNGPTTTQIVNAEAFALAALVSRDEAAGFALAAGDSADAAAASESACAGYQAAVQAEGTTQVNRVIGEGNTQHDRVEAEGTTQVGLAADQVTLATAQKTLAAEYATQAEDVPITGHPTDYSAYHWSKKAEAAAQGGTVKVSADDTTPGYLEAKFAAASNGGIVLATTSPAGNEVRTISIDLGTDPGLEITADGLEVKVKPGGGLVKDADGLSANISSGYPIDYISGLGLRIDTDTDHDIEIQVGACRDSTNAADLTLSAVLTKRIDAAWGAGDDGGGMDTGSVGNSTYYYVWLIKKDSDNSIDALFSASATAPTMPAGYTYKRCIGRLRTNGSANINANMLISANPAIGGREIWTTTESTGAYIQPPWTPDFDVEVQGGGGAGGGGASAGSSGGASGGYGKKRIRGQSSATSTTVTVGAAGAGVSGDTGGSGGTSSFGAIVSCTGGGGGARGVNASGGTAGGSTGGDINISGQSGQTSYLCDSSTPQGGKGADSLFGMGGTGTTGSGSSTGIAGSGYGSGGGGMGNGSNSTYGGSGGPGVVIITF